MIMQHQNKDVLRERGRDALEFWAESMRCRAKENPDHRTMFAAIPPPKNKVTTRSDRPPTVLPEPQRRVLAVESAFRSIGLRAAEEVYGPQEGMSAINSLAWQGYVQHVRYNVRDLCFHSLVAKRRSKDWEDRQTFSAMAKYGMTKGGFQTWLAERLKGIERDIGRYV